MFVKTTSVACNKGLQGRNNGFTLLEALVALLVLSLIMTTGLGSLRLGGQSWEAGINHANDTEVLRTVTDFLRRQFGQLLTTTWVDDGKQRIAFEGNSDKVRFITPGPQQLESTGLLMYTLSVEDNELDKQLILSHAALDPGAEGFGESPDAERLVLAEQLQQVSFSYYGQMTPTQMPGWHTHWGVEAEAFPEMIRIQVDARGGEQPWPELLLVIRTGGIS